MTIKSAKTLVADALSEVKTISPSEALELSNKNECNLIDIRDGIELLNLGKIENSFHISRGLLEFSLHPDSPYVQNSNLDLNKVLGFKPNEDQNRLINSISSFANFNFIHFWSTCQKCPSLDLKI